MMKVAKREHYLLTLSCPGTAIAIVKLGHSNLRPGSKEMIEDLSGKWNPEWHKILFICLEESCGSSTCVLLTCPACAANRYYKAHAMCYCICGTHVILVKDPQLSFLKSRELV